MHACLLYFRPASPLAAAPKKKQGTRSQTLPRPALVDAAAPDTHAISITINRLSNATHQPTFHCFSTAAALAAYRRCAPPWRTYNPWLSYNPWLADNPWLTL